MFNVTDAGPPYAKQGVDERRKFAAWALWDFVEGLRLRKMWARQSWNEVQRRYKRTMLGPLWVTVSLILFAVVLSFVWAGLWKMQVREFLPFLLSGFIPWTMISGAIGESCAAFIHNEALMKSRQFPYSTLVYVVLARNVVIFGHNLLGYVIAAVLCGVAFGWATLLLVPGVVLVVLNGGWICVVVAILCLRFRDFQPLVVSLLQIAMFVTPIFWSADQLQGKRAVIVHVNPLHHMIEVIRQPMLGKVAAPASYLICVAAAVAGWLFAYWLFARKRQRLAFWF
jgi:ABC-type polysaccharide/polyol phosphate export permease